MTPKELIELPVVRESGLSEMMNGTPWPGMNENWQWLIDSSKFPNIVVKVHGSVRHDARRDWVVFSVWYKGVPVAVGRAAGRERDDDFDRWVINDTEYRQMVGEIAAVMTVHDQVPCLDINQDIGDVLNWYGERVIPGRSIDRQY